MVEEIMPPIMAIPIATLGLDASLRPIAIGIVPAIRAIDVMMIGLNLVRPALISAVLRSIPLAIAWLAKSTRRIEFLPETPINKNIPKIVKILKLCCVTNRARNAPDSARGNANIMVIGVIKDS